MKFLRKAVFLDTTVVQAGTFEEALELFKEEDYQYPGKPEEVQYFLQEDKVSHKQDEAGNWVIFTINSPERVLMYVSDYPAADSLTSIINRNNATRMMVNG